MHLPKWFHCAEIFDIKQRRKTINFLVGYPNMTNISASINSMEIKMKKIRTITQVIIL